MLHREHSAIISAFIKLPFVIKIFVCLFLSGCLRQVLLYYFYRKSPDEAFASFKREESDSSVIDPETEGNNTGLDKQKCSA